MPTAIHFTKTGIISTHKAKPQYNIFSSYPYTNVLKPLDWQQTKKHALEILFSTTTLRFANITSKTLQTILVDNLELTESTLKEVLSNIVYTQTITPEKLIRPLLKLKDDIILLNIEPWKISITYAMAITVGGTTQYEMYTFTSQLKTLDTLINSRLPELLAFLTEQIPNEQLLNILSNLNMYLPIATTSTQIMDIVRAIISILIKEISADFKIKTPRAGHVFITGELAQLLYNPAYTLTPVIDGLGLEGLWSINVDLKGDFLLNLLSSTLAPTTLEYLTQSVLLCSLPKTNMQHVKAVYQSKKQQEFLLTKNNIHIYKDSTQLKQLMLPINNITNLTLNALNKQINTLIIDTRQRPILYGPTANHNIHAKNMISKLTLDNNV